MTTMSRMMGAGEQDITEQVRSSIRMGLHFCRMALQFHRIKHSCLALC